MEASIGLEEKKVERGVASALLVVLYGMKLNNIFQYVKSLVRIIRNIFLILLQKFIAKNGKIKKPKLRNLTIEERLGMVRVPTTPR